jgi:Ser/Thr protein kinase RdoA (MazF antagonist)
MTPRDSAHPFDRLDPVTVLDAMESVGLPTDGRLFALNSYENRVYRIGLDRPLEPRGPRPAGVVADQVVAKFYRPGRWSDAQIEEEHAFGRELADADLPVAAPVFRDGRSLFRHAGFRFAVFECRRGGAPELDAPGARQLLGRTLGRLHSRAATRPFRYRESMADARYGARARQGVLDSGLLPPALVDRYAEVSQRLADEIAAGFEAAGPVMQQRLHGDCHLGNILWDDSGPVFVDLDDCLSGPCVQDLWMFLSGGDAAAQRAEWTALLEGYEQFADFDYRQAALIEPLRAMRMLHHSAWLALRWEDPAFPRAFPWFAEPRYWERQVTDLAEQLDALRDPPLLRS